MRRAVWFATIWLLGCAANPQPAPVEPAPVLWGCMAAGTRSSPDSIFLVFFHHPCDSQADSVVGWRIPSRLRECDLFLVADAVTGRLETSWRNCRVQRRSDG